MSTDRSTAVQIDYQPTTRVNGIRFGVRDHFTQGEWDHILYYDTRRYVTRLAARPLEQYEDPAFLTGEPHDMYELRYIRCLAFYARTRLPLTFALAQIYTPAAFPLDDAPKMQEWRRVFNDHYAQVFTMDAGNERRRNDVSVRLESLTFALSLAGFGVTTSFGYEAISTSVLEQILAMPISERKKQAVRWMSRFLALNPLSAITSEIGFPDKESELSRERRLWQNLLDESRSEITVRLQSYVFGELLQRIESPVIRTAPTTGRTTEITSTRIGKGKIAWSTWNGSSIHLRNLARYCLENSFDTVNQLLCVNDKGETGLDQFMMRMERTSSQSYYDFCRSAIRTLLEWYSASHDASINVKRLFPRLQRRSSRRYGYVLNMGAMQLLIFTLLDPESPFINENDLMQFRCRRAVLIQLATGARIESVCLLLQDCLSEHDGRTWLRLHKTKRGKEHRVEVKADVVQWIREAIMVSPDQEITAPKGHDKPGDGLTRKRVFANSRNSGVLTGSTVNRFLSMVQQQLWTHVHPNGREFRTHDLRRTKATQMLSHGHNLDDIKEQLGQNGVRSLIPYLATGAPEFQQWFREIFEEGVWENSSAAPETSDAMAVDTVIEQSLKQTSTMAAQQLVMRLIQDAEDDVGRKLVDPAIIPLSATREGLPRMMHNCTAHLGVNCGHTELDCFGCSNHYRPDQGSLPAHVVELFRWMVRIIHGEELERRRKKKQRTEAFQSPASIREKLEQALRVLLKDKFQLTSTARKEVSKRLWAAANLYYRSCSKQNPAPTHQEAYDFLSGLPSTQSPLDV